MNPPNAAARAETSIKTPMAREESAFSAVDEDSDIAEHQDRREQRKTGRMHERSGRACEDCRGGDRPHKPDRRGETQTRAWPPSPAASASRPPSTGSGSCSRSGRRQKCAEQGSGARRSPAESSRGPVPGRADIEIARKPEPEQPEQDEHQSRREVLGELAQAHVVTGGVSARFRTSAAPSRGQPREGSDKVRHRQP